MGRDNDHRLCISWNADLPPTEEASEGHCGANAQETFDGRTEEMEIEEIEQN